MIMDTSLDPKSPQAGSERIYEILTRLGRLIQSEERASGELVPVQLHALAYLSRCNRYSDRPAAVGEYLGVTKGTASQTLQALQRKGLITKEADSEDGRVVHLRLTEEGREHLRHGRPEAFKRALAKLGEEESSALGKSLEALLLGLQRGHGGRTFGICRTCRHFRDLGPEGFRCGLTHEPLALPESRLLCREHETPGPSPRTGSKGR